MSTMSIRRVGIAVLAAASLSAATASVPAVSHAQPNNGGGGTGKSCHLPGGKVLTDGSSGADYGGGKTYQCDDGIACQVEGGKKTDKCSHTERGISVSRPVRVKVNARL